MIKKHLVPLTLIAFGLALPSMLHHTLLHVLTPSVPPGWYFVERISTPHIGDYVVACLPIPLATLGFQRGYLIPGDCPGNVAPLVKVLAAQGGDVVSISAQGASVNGRHIASPPETHDAHGVLLSPMRFAAYPVPSGQAWLFGISPHSWDSRYFGPVTSTSIIGHAHPIFTDPSAK